jgi:hypothetical protein
LSENQRTTRLDDSLLDPTTTRSSIRDTPRNLFVFSKLNPNPLLGWIEFANSCGRAKRMHHKETDDKRNETAMRKRATTSKRSCWIRLLCCCVFLLVAQPFSEPIHAFSFLQSLTTRHHSTASSLSNVSFPKTRRGRRLFSKSPSLSRSSSSSSSSPTSLRTPPTNKTKPNKRKKFFLIVWIHVLSGFVVTNYVRTTVWPRCLLRFPLIAWNLVHGLSAMMFAGGIITTTLLEWNLSMEESNVFPKLLQVETVLVLPALTGSILSGVAQAFHSYASLRHAPRHVKSALHVLLLFGLWWGLTDRRSQAKIEQAMEQGEFDKAMLAGRRISNLVSCGFLLALYGIMILKPG